ncbi:hypothetical protein AAMO2058_001697000 [Amorphochlora amoebiformis]
MERRAEARLRVSRSPTNPGRCLREVQYKFSVVVGTGLLNRAKVCEMHNRVRNIQLLFLYHALVARFDDRWSLNGSYLVDIGLQLAQTPEEGCNGKTLGERGRNRMLVVSTQGEIWREGGEYNILHVYKTLPARK